MTTTSGDANLQRAAPNHFRIPAPRLPVKRASPSPREAGRRAGASLDPGGLTSRFVVSDDTRHAGRIVSRRAVVEHAREHLAQALRRAGPEAFELGARERLQVFDAPDRAQTRLRPDRNRRATHGERRAPAFSFNTVVVVRPRAHGLCAYHEQQNGRCVESRRTWLPRPGVRLHPARNVRAPTWLEAKQTTRSGIRHSTESSTSIYQRV
jgi:hypothetical protein